MPITAPGNRFRSERPPRQRLIEDDLGQVRREAELVAGRDDPLHRQLTGRAAQPDQRLEPVHLLARQVDQGLEVHGDLSR